MLRIQANSRTATPAENTASRRALMDAVPNSDLAGLSNDLKGLNAKPLWERTTRMGPGTPARPTIWRYREMLPQLLRAIDLISAKEAERPVFMLENPGLPGSGYITSSLYCG